MNHAVRLRRLTILATCYAVAFLLAPAAIRAQAEGRCASAEVPAVMVMPDGSVYPPGSLRICMDGIYSPVAGLHRTSVEGAVVGMYVSKVGTSAVPAGVDRPFFMFTRNGLGELELRGYAWPRGDRLQVFTIREEEGARVETHWRVASERPGEDGPWFLVAATRF